MFLIALYVCSVCSLFLFALHVCPLYSLFVFVLHGSSVDRPPFSSPPSMVHFPTDSQVSALRRAVHQGSVSQRPTIRGPPSISHTSVFMLQRLVLQSPPSQQPILRNIVILSLLSSFFFFSSFKSFLSLARDLILTFVFLLLYNHRTTNLLDLFKELPVTNLRYFMGNCQAGVVVC